MRKMCIRDSLSFTGTDRRFEYQGTFDGVTVVDDYAHHPTEIKATLKAAQHYPHNSVWCVFQPHTYTRTKAFFHEFAEALSHADHLVLADIYAARETDTLGISSADLAEEAAKLGTDSHYFPSFAEIESFLKENCRPGDLLITMGAGDIVTEMCIRDRYYLAVVRGIPSPSEADLMDYLVKDGRSNTSRVCTAETPGARPARLHYRLAETYGEGSGTSSCLLYTSSRSRRRPRSVLYRTTIR